MFEYFHLIAESTFGSEKETKTLFNLLSDWVHNLFKLMVQFLGDLRIVKPFYFIIVYYVLIWVRLP